MSILTTLFWLSFILIFYIYLGYPILLLLMVWKQSRGMTTAKTRDPFDERYPSVSILIAAYNEESVIEATILNKLETAYPLNRLEILVASDASTDRTDSIIVELATRLHREQCPVNIQCFRQQSRQGKTAALNMLVTHASGSMLVISDANSLYHSHALTHLVRHFKKREVGYVSGRMVSMNAEGCLIGDGNSAYLRYENLLRRWETDLGGVIGVDGGIDAMRSDLYEPLRPDQLPDFVQPLKVAEKGFLVIFEPEAIVMEKANSDSDSEMAMRVRVALRGLRAIRDMKHLLVPWKHGFLSVKLWSHKLLRYLAFIPLIVMLLTSLLLAYNSVLFRVMVVGQAVFYGVAGIGFFSSRIAAKSKLIGLPYYFTLLNVACFRAFFRFLTGDKAITWEPRKGQAHSRIIKKTG